jgi:hypothetical protein
MFKKAPLPLFQSSPLQPKRLRRSLLYHHSNCKKKQARLNFSAIPLPKIIKKQLKVRIYVKITLMR